MKTRIGVVALLAAGAVFTARADTIVNAWSGVSGDKANCAAFAFKADAGIYPDSVTPAGALSPTFFLNAVTLTRPGDTTTPSIGTGARQITSADAPVYLDVYAGLDSGVFTGYLGSSATAVTCAGTASDQPYTFDFNGLTLESSVKYWFVFSEDALEGEVSNFRFKVNTSGDNLTPGQGKGYLVNDTAQVMKQNGATDDWGTAYTVTVTAVPEPSTIALLALGGVALFLRRRI